MYFELRTASDLAHAKEVAAFLNRQIKQVTVDRRLEEYVLGSRLVE